MLRIGVDIGGTFTDFTVWNDKAGGYGEIEVFKVPSTPPNFAEGVKAGILMLLADDKIAADEEVLIVHGTTVATNAVIERKGPPMALLVTKGFKNILDMQRLRMDNPIDLFGVRAAALVPSGMVFEIDERLLADGSVDCPLDEAGVAEATRMAIAQGASSIAVCFMHSFRNPAHELRAAEILRQVEGGVEFVLSHEIWAQEGEYERASAAVLNAFARNAMTGYIDELHRFLEERLPNGRLLVTKSNGGAMNASEATYYPIHSLLSGPASGVTAATTLGGMLDAPNLLTMDMGGTSTDISIVRDGQGIVSQHGKVGDFPIIMPVMAIEAIGAGGGSIAWMDGGILKVGPRSAGARPGPACYNVGGTLPTLSDAYLLCGYLSEDTPLASGIKLRRDLAAAAMQPIADALGCDVTEAADKCITVATSNMLAKALPFIARIGATPAELTLMIFGGAGAIHGPLLSAEIGIGRIIVPKFSSVFCAFGGLVTDLLYDSIHPARGLPMTAEAMQSAFGKMRVNAAEWLHKQAPSIQPEFEYSASLRYAGQSFDVHTQLSAEIVANGDMAAMADRFHDEHERLFMHSHPGREISAISYQLRVRGKLPSPSKEIAGATRTSVAVESVPGRLFINGEWHEAARYRQDSLPADWSIVGPAVIEQTTSTTVIPPNFRVSLSKFGDLTMERAN